MSTEQNSLPNIRARDPTFVYIVNKWTDPETSRTLPSQLEYCFIFVWNERENSRQFQSEKEDFATLLFNFIK